MTEIVRTTASLLAAVLILLAASACGTSSPGSSPSGQTTAGPGLTQPTNPHGPRVTGGTVYFTEFPNVTPNYIFPLTNFADCSTANVNQFTATMYRPLYWYGNDYRPTVDYGYSIGQKPVFSNHNLTVTIRLKPWRWSDGEAVTSRDLVLWMNLLKPNPGEWCGYIPGYFPDNVTSYSAPDARTFVLHFNRSYNPQWVLYNELSQLTPLPLAWDRTSLAQPPPMSDDGHLPDTTRVGAAAVYRFLDGQSKRLGSWTSSPLWRVVDGPFRLEGFTNAGQLTLVPNPHYSGSPKPVISRLVERPFVSDAAIDIALRSGGPTGLTIASLPSEYAGTLPALTAEGYSVNRASSYSFSYFPLNFNSSARTTPGGEPIRFVFRQAYFRRALQRLVGQLRWIKAFFRGTATPTCGPIPLAPPNPVAKTAAISTAPCAFSPAAARRLLTAHGWKVVPGGITTCIRAGSSGGECGAGINAGEGISFNLDYSSGFLWLQDEMADLAAQARKVGIRISLSTHTIQGVIGAMGPCQSSRGCSWTAENSGAGWVYGPDFLPTGEWLFNPTSPTNAGGYSDPTMTRLIAATITGPAARESAALATYARYVQDQAPVIFTPTSIGTFYPDAGTLVAKKLGGYAANALGYMNPEDWYFTR